MGWRAIKTAPHDGSIITIKTAGGNKLQASFQPGFMVSAIEDAGGWVAEDENGAPECWTDGVCWSTNADGVKSDQPVKWLSI